MKTYIKKLDFGILYNTYKQQNWRSSTAIKISFIWQRFKL